MGVILFREKLLIIFLCATSCIFLSSCLFFPGEKKWGVTQCPRDEETGDYKISFPPLNCEMKNDVAPLIIPKRYSPVCSTVFSRIEAVTLNVNYPDFQPETINAQDNKIQITISSGGGVCKAHTAPSAEDESKRFAGYIKRDGDYVEQNGRHDFAPVRALGDNLYLQEYIKEPYDGNSSHYFYKEGSGKIVAFLGCDHFDTCYIQPNISLSDNDYGVSYVTKGVPIEDYFDVRSEVEKQVSKFFRHPDVKK